MAHGYLGVITDLNIKVGGINEVIVTLNNKERTISLTTDEKTKNLKIGDLIYYEAGFSDNHTLSRVLRYPQTPEKIIEIKIYDPHHKKNTTL